MTTIANPFDLLIDQIRQVVREEVAAAVKTQPKPKLLLDTNEAANILGVPSTWLAQAARENKIATVRVGHYVRFRITDLEKFINDQKGNGNHGSSK